MVNIHGTFLWKAKEVSQLLRYFNKFTMNLVANETKYECIKLVNSTTDQWNDGYKTMI